MSNMAFSKSIQAMREFRKTVTRRYGWANVKPAQIVQAVEKGQGIPRGEHVVPIHEIQLLTPRWERADLMITDQAYGEREVILEGFPELSPKEFVQMLCEMNKKRPDELVHRLEFRHLLRGKRNRIVVRGQDYFIEPNRFELQLDGTLAGWFHPSKDLEISRWAIETLRFEIE